jgi:hypothetical protein
VEYTDRKRSPFLSSYSGLFTNSPDKKKIVNGKKRTGRSSVIDYCSGLGRAYPRQQLQLLLRSRFKSIGKLTDFGLSEFSPMAIVLLPLYPERATKPMSTSITIDPIICNSLTEIFLISTASETCQ